MKQEMLTEKKKAYHIVQWDSLYETATTRKIRTLTFYAKPNKLVGEGIGLTLAQEDNVALLGTWALIEAVASTAPREQRGWLVRNGTPLTPARLAAMTRVKAQYFERALEFFCQPDVAWLELIELPGQSAGELPEKLKNNLAQESAGTNLQREREEGRDLREKGEGALSGGFPTVEEVRAWAVQHALDPDFAEEKHMQHTTRNGWMVRGQPVDWKTRWLDYWKQEGEEWSARRKKNVRGTNGRPPGWQAGDADVWWTDSLADLRSAISGAALAVDAKTVARLQSIIALREKEAR
jgi:hypothetical protein